MKKYFRLLVIFLVFSCWIPHIASAQVVRVPDENLAVLVRHRLGLPQNAHITKADMQRLERLNIINIPIKDLTGLEHATKLVELEIRISQIRNLSPLSRLSALRVLNFDNNQISDLSPLANLTQLRVLSVGSNQISDVRPLTRLTQLEWLYLEINQISDVRSLAGLTRLKVLWLNYNNIRDVSALARLVNLETLQLAGNPITDTSPLASLRKLREVDIIITVQRPQRPVGTTDPPSRTVAIPDRNLAASVRKALGLRSNASITEQNMQKLRRLIANGQQIRNLTGLEHATQLTVLNLDSNQISNVSPLAQLTQLQWLYLRHNEIRDVRPLTGLRKLRTLHLTQNNIRDVSPLAKLVNLRSLRLRGNPITDTSPLTSLPEATNIDIKISRDPVVHVGEAQRPPMYWINSEAGTLHRLVGTEVENFIPQVQNATSLAVDTTDNKIYWTEKMGNRGRIKRANLDGSNVEILATPFGVPRSIAVDTMQEMLYWSDSRGRIQRSNLSGKQIKNLIRNLKSPDNITIDVAGGKLYWTEAPGNIRRANLNGRDIEDIASGLGPVGDIAISGTKIYWTEITGGNFGKIGRANLNGSNARTLATPLNGAFDIAIDAVDKKLYWTNSIGNIRRANLVGRLTKNVVSDLTSTADLALGISGTSTAAAPLNSSFTSSDTPTPDATGLLSNYPNPFNPETWIPYQLSEPADVTLTIYAVNGEVVRRLVLGYQAAGVYQSRSRAAYWDGRNAWGEPVASGVYFYTLTAGEFSATRKMLIRK